MPTANEITELEEAAADALPALQTQRFDGWLLASLAFTREAETLVKTLPLDSPIDRPHGVDLLETPNDEWMDLGNGCHLAAP